MNSLKPNLPISSKSITHQRHRYHITISHQDLPRQYHSLPPIGIHLLELPLVIISVPQARLAQTRQYPHLSGLQPLRGGAALAATSTSVTLPFFLAGHANCLLDRGDVLIYNLNTL